MIIGYMVTCLAEFAKVSFSEFIRFFAIQCNNCRNYPSGLYRYKNGRRGFIFFKGTIDTCHIVYSIVIKE